MAALVKIGDAVFPMSDAAGGGLHRFLVEERRAYDSLQQDCDKQFAEMHARHTADQAAAEALLAEAQEQIAAMKKTAAGWHDGYLMADERAKQAEAKARRLEGRLAEQPGYWFFFFSSAIFAAMFFASLMVHLTR